MGAAIAAAAALVLLAFRKPAPPTAPTAPRTPKTVAKPTTALTAALPRAASNIRAPTRFASLGAVTGPKPMRLAPPRPPAKPKAAGPTRTEANMVRLLAKEGLAGDWNPAFTGGDGWGDDDFRNYERLRPKILAWAKNGQLPGPVDEAHAVLLETIYQHRKARKSMPGGGGSGKEWVDKDGNIKLAGRSRLDQLGDWLGDNLKPMMQAAAVACGHPEIAVIIQAGAAGYKKKLQEQAKGELNSQVDSRTGGSLGGGYSL